MTRPIARVIIVVVAVALGGCGATSKTYVSATEQRALPTTQLSASRELCPDRDQPERVRLALKRRADQHVDALLQAFRRHPDALVRTTYASSDEGPGKADLSVKKLVQQWVQFSYCAPKVQKQLKAALQAEDHAHEPDVGQ
jgi:hypothetical protein